MNLICFTHPTYQGTDNPILACKSCCMIFLAQLKVQQAAKEEAKHDQRQWLLEKVKAAPLGFDQLGDSSVGWTAKVS